MDVAVIGSSRFVVGFKLAGVRRTITAEPADYQPKLEAVLADPKVGILVVNDEDVERLPGGLKRRLGDSVRPVVKIGRAHV